MLRDWARRAGYPVSAHSVDALAFHTTGETVRKGDNQATQEN